MADLRLTGVSEDGERLLLVGDDGAEHSVEIDGRLRDAVRGQGRAGRGETPMESTLRPRDIQARIRAGETPEAVAQLAQTSVDRIMTYAGPVLAERQHVAQRAQRSSVRRRSERSESAGAARTLGEAVAARLRTEHLAADAVEWDAWRREDNRWTLTATCATGPRPGTAHFTFDVPGNYVLLDDDDARWLVGDSVAGAADPAAPGGPAGEAPARNDLEHARRRRLSAVREEEGEQLPLGVDAIELVRDDAAVPAAEPAAVPASEESTDSPIEAFLDDQPGLDETPQAEQAGDAAALDPDPEPDPEPEAPARRPVRKRGGRASVPSWDEIMFGGGKQE